VKTLFKILRFVGAGTLLIFLLLAIWQPVFPSILIVDGMAKAIDPRKVPLDPPTIVRFELSGKGGGIYTIVVEKDSVEIVRDERTANVDLILYMEARDFNDMMFALADGKADEYTVRSLIISKALRYAGDMSVFSKLFEKKGDDP
jgi:hypothetical protein